MHNGPHWPSHTICAGPSYSNYPLRRSEMDVSLFPWWKVSRLSCNLTATRQDSRCCFYAGFVAQCSLLRAFLTFPTELWHKILRWKACSKLLYWVQTEKHNLYSSREYLEIRSFPTEYTSLNFKLITTIQEDWDWITRAFQIYWNPKLCASHLGWIKWISSNIHGKCFRSRQLILVSHLTALNVFCFIHKLQEL